MKVFDLLVLRPFFQRFLLFTCLSAPLLALGIRPLLIDWWKSRFLDNFDFVLIAGLTLCLAACFGLNLAITGSRLKYAWLHRRKAVNTSQYARNKAR